MAAERNPGFPGLNTPEWGTMNQRRALLIDKYQSGGATASELAELERLQDQVALEVEGMYPIHGMFDERLDNIIKRLGNE